MTTMRPLARTFAVLFLAGCAGTPADEVRSAALEDAPSPALDQYMLEQVDSGFSGVLLVRRAGQTLVHRAYTANPAIHSGTSFWIGSLSKPFAAVAILQLEADGRLSVQDPISHHLADVPADRQQITVHQLLTHTSGLPGVYAADGVADRETAVRRLLAAPLLHAPGTAFAYSNDGYSLLAVIVERAAGIDFDAYMRERIFGPARMTRSGLWGQAGAAEVARVRRRPRANIARENWGYRGATGIRSTVTDLERWFDAIHSNVLLSPAAVEQMWSPHAVRSESRAYGYGWQLTRT